MGPSMANRNPKVLIVDDQRGMRLTLAGIIEDRGYRVTAVADGPQAIEASKKSAFDLIFMDIRMPGLSGVETLRKIKRIRPKSIVVMMTGYGGEREVRDALAEGAYSVIDKPFDPEMVLRLVHSVRPTVIILVVDEVAATADGLKSVLHETGYAVAEASSEEQVVELVRARRCDIIVVGNDPSGENGVGSFRKIKAADPEARVIFTTGSSSGDAVGMALEVGSYGGSRRSLDPTSILALVKELTAGGDIDE